MGETSQIRLELTTELDGDSVDYSIQMPAEATGQELLDLISTESGRTVTQLYAVRSGEPIRANATLIENKITAGDRLSLRPPTKTRFRPKVEFQIHSGPAQGQTLTVYSGATLGRKTNRGLDHQSVSREHCRIDQVPSGVQVTDCKSKNGTLVNGMPVSPESGTDMHPGDKLELGSIILELVSNSQAPRRIDRLSLPLHSGYLHFRRQPRVGYPRPDLDFRVSDPPSEPPKRKFPLAAAAVPVVLGAAMAVLLTPIYALFTALGPIMLIVSYVDDRRSGRSDHAEKVREWQNELRQTKLSISDSVDQETGWRRRRAPQLDSLIRWVRVGSRELWSRRPNDIHDDFLVVAPADADQASDVKVQLPTQGAKDLLEEAKTAQDEVAGKQVLPVEIDFNQTPVIGLVGRTALTVDVARSLVAQLVSLRSYRDLQVALLAPTKLHDWGWLKWLPHTRLDFDTNLQMLSGDSAEARAVFEQLVEIQEARRKAAEDRIGAGRRAFSPTFVVIIHAPVNLPARTMDRFLERSADTGFIVLFVVEDDAGLPGQAKVLVREEQSSSSVQVTFTATGRVVSQALPRRLSSDDSELLARDLCPIVDVSAGSDGGEIPKIITLHEAVGESRLTEAGIAKLWSAARTSFPAVIGATEDGPLTLDLKKDGPHGLVAGTTGAGKSEFLQTLVASLAAHHSPTRLNFILIDYKGGSAFRECEDLPHTIGFVTNLDDHLANRALISLRAELRRRETLFNQASVGGLAEMVEKNPDNAPPALLIVIDEFAALKTEVPEFVDGLVDVAQRGRSMGVHMILATQRPSGVITPQIDANTNFRVALRVANQGDSTDIIDSPVAANISTDQAGRGFLKIGGGAKLTAFQSAYVGGEASDQPTMNPPFIEPFSFSMEPRRKPEDAGSTSKSELTDLGRLVRATSAAWKAAGAPTLHKPWQEVLADSVLLETMLADNSDPSGIPTIPIGLADFPHKQMQVYHPINLSEVGNLAIYGTAGSGKTTFVRTLFCSISRLASPGEVALYGLDFGGGLSMMESLPTVGGIVAGNDRERLQILLGMLQRDVESRRELLAEHRAGSLAELRGILDEDAPPYVVVAIDGFAQLWATLESFNYSQQTEEFERLFSEGRSVGIHFVVTASQRTDIPHSCNGAIGLRLLQRLPKDEYSGFDIRNAPDSKLMPPGRTLMTDGPELQIAVPGLEHTDGPGQARWIEAFGRELGRLGHTSPKRVETLGEIVDCGDLPETLELRQTYVGLSTSLEPVAVDFVNTPTLLIAGEGGSGRSTALGTILCQLAPVVADRRVFVTKRSSPLNTGEGYGKVISENIEVALEELATEVKQRSIDRDWASPMIVAIDDAESLFSDITVDSALGSILLSARDAGVVLLATATTFRALQCFDAWLREMVSNGQGIVLQPEGSNSEDLFDVRFPRGSAVTFPPGRGYLIARSQTTVVQLATT